MRSQAREQAGAVDLTAVVVAVTDDDPRVLVVRREATARRPGRRRPHGHGGCDALPSGPLAPRHRTLDAGLRAWVEAQTRTTLGYVEQLYTFGDRDRDRPEGRRGMRALSIGYLALVREVPASAADPTRWQNWYRYFPWEDWRRGEPPIVGSIARALARWAGDAATRDLRRARRARLAVTFGRGTAWNDERVLDRYELLYEVGLVPEAHRKRRQPSAPPVDSLADAEPMAADHRRILATAIGRLRGKIKYRPVVFELMPPTFTLLQLQRTVEALAGLRLHKQNFRRLVAQQGLVEDTGRILTGTGGRPAREVRFRPDAILERLAPGVRLPATRRTT
jgi:hypothetical protein